MPRERITASLSELQRRTGLHRVTIRRRLDEAQITPASAKYNEKRYDVETATKVLASSNGNGREPSLLNEARRRKTIAEAARITLKLQRERGDLVPLNEIRDQLFQFIKAMHTRIARRYPRENARRLRKCRGAADLAHTLEVDLSLIFDELKRDYPQML
jgi:hypothetical protein